MKIKADVGKLATSLVARILSNMKDSIGDVMFKYGVNTGMVMCVVEPGEETQVDDTTENVELEDSAGTEQSAVVEGAEDKDQATGGEDDDVVITIGEEAPPPEQEQHAQAPEWVKELRKNHRELQRENRELKEKVKAVTGAETKPAPLGVKPTLEGCDYDAEKFEAELATWYDKKRQVDDQEAQAKAAEENQKKAWQAKLDSYTKAKTDLKVKDFDEVEVVAQEMLSVTQQGIILQGSENPALMVYALGKNPKKAKELSSITDPVKFAFAVAKLETQLKVTNRKAAPPPEKVVRGSGSSAGTVDSHLDRLRADAEKTGDYSKVVAYKKQKRA